MARTKKLPNYKKLSVMVPAKLTPPEHKIFLKIVEEENLQYASQLIRKILVEYLTAYQMKQKENKDE